MALCSKVRKVAIDGRIVVVPNHGSKGVEKETYYNILKQAGIAEK